ncbi:hypothetical protein NUW58_g10150 [Xylaria curta]|uniref:Uncharacterized protein n=1 Tax=Xylaria curta TaxID=42375 RepID=A0ACC1MR60_9PEZI|nr:hypothetical protein NUW58_g10150 [Xylaria curta]
MGEEKEKERLSSESGRPSLDSLVGRTEGTSSPSQFRSSGEQRRRTSFESHDGSEPPRARKSSLAPVAERKSEYGMDGFLMKAPTDQSPFLQEPTTSSPELSRLSNEPSDEIKSDLLKSRRFSTSPQLPILTRVSGFGDDFFSGPSGYSSQASPKLPTSAEERRSLHNDMDVIKPPVDNTEKQPPNTLGATKEVSTKLDVKPPEVASPEVTEEGTMQLTQPQHDRTRPQLPGGWVSESLSILVPSEQSTPSEKQEAKGSTNFANLKSISVSPVTESGPEPSGIFSSTGNPSLPPSTDMPGNMLNVNEASQPSAKGRGTATGQHNDATASGALVAGDHHPTPQSLPPLKTEIPSTQPLSRPISTVAPAIRDMSPEQPTTITTSGSGFSPTAPLNFNRAQAVGQSDFILPSTRIRKSTNSTIDTTSPEKDNDKLRDEIIKSLSPAPISPGSSGLPAKAEQGIEQAPGDLTRESTYLAGVYDDYLSPTEEKSPREVNSTANESTPMAPNQSSETPNASAAKLRDMSISQTVQMAPPQSVQSPVPEESTRLRRFSWQQDPEEVVLSPTESKLDTSVFPQESLVRNQSGMNAESSTNLNTVSPITDSLQAEAGAAGTISHQVSQVSSRGLEDTTLAAIEPPSPISFVGPRGPHPASDERNVARLSLADEKEKVLIGDTQSATSSVSDQHPALAKAPEQGDRGPSPVLRLPDVAASRPQATPTPFREILNFATYEERVQKFDETREQFLRHGFRVCRIG